MIKDIYEAHQQAFKGVTAYVITDNVSNRLATIAFKWGQNRVTCYLHIIGLCMVKGTANGGGYDRASASAYAAIGKVKLPPVNQSDFEAYRELHGKFSDALRKGDGASNWDRELRDAGFEVFQAV